MAWLYTRLASARIFMNNYPVMLQEIKDRIQRARIRATMSANAEMLLMYWDVGRLIAERQSTEGWGAKIIQRLAKDIRNELPEVKGFSERNLKRMLLFYNEYNMLQFGPPTVAQIAAGDASLLGPSPVAQSAQGKASGPDSQLLDFVPRLPWAHNVVLLGLKDKVARLWYMAKTIEHGWSKAWLSEQIKRGAFERQGQAVTNFGVQLPSTQSALAQEALKDPYIFDFLTLEERFHERELETGLVTHVEKFLLELGAGFAFLGRQYHLAVSDQDFYIDLLFYHTKLHCYVVVELKSGNFKPEYVGKVNFYCSAVDDILRHELDNPTIGLILCQTNDRIIAEYTLKKVNTPIGVSEYELTRALPENLKSSLPTIEELEDRLEESL
jgi:predicted nuclease of restriction endonuclease-like (RecB) superfamily